MRGEKVCAPWRTQNLSGSLRTLVSWVTWVGIQLRKNRPFAQIIAVQLTRACLGSAHADQSQTEIGQHNLEAKEQKRMHITESIISGSKYPRNTI